MKALISTILLLSVSGQLSVASEEIKVGEYLLGDCRISVRPGIVKNTLLIRADKGSEFGKIILDQNTNEVTAINVCNDPIMNLKDFPISSERTEDESSRTYTAKCGGTWHGVNGKAFVSFDPAGKVNTMAVKFKIAKWSLPNGLNSGPIKFAADQISCIEKKL